MIINEENFKKLFEFYKENFAKEELAKLLALKEAGNKAFESSNGPSDVKIFGEPFRIDVNEPWVYNGDLVKWEPLLGTDSESNHVYDSIDHKSSWDYLPTEEHYTKDKTKVKDYCSMRDYSTFGPTTSTLE